MIKTQGQFIDFIQTVFGSGVFSNAGKNISVICPLCAKAKGKSYKNRKLVIKTDNSINHCWVCGYKSRDLSFLIKVFYPWLYEEYKTNYLNHKNILKDEDCEKENDFIRNEVHIPIGSRLLVENLKFKESKKFLYYLKKRGIEEERDLWYWKFLYSYESEEQANRIILPSFDEVGKLNYYTGRHIYIDNGPRKYKNSSNEKEAIIFNEINIDWTKPLTLVEGPFDLIKSNANSTCLLGSTIDITNHLFQKIVINATPIILGLDADARNKAFKIALNFMEYDLDVSMLNCEDDKDIGSMTKDEFNKLYNLKQKITKKDLLLHKIRNINV